MNMDVTSRIVSNIIHFSTIFSFRKIMKMPPLKAHHIRAPVEWKNQAIENCEDWNIITFSDKKKFNSDRSDCFECYSQYLRKERRHLSKRHSGGGSLMVWTAFSSSMKTHLFC